MDFSAEQLKSFFLCRKRLEIRNDTLARAGVLVPLFEKQGLLHLLLTKRTEDVEHHKGQISFPGGAMDARDADIVATALRESEEELGLSANAVEVLGVCDDHATPSGFIITPVVGYIHSLPILQVSTIEVARVLEVPMSLFLDKSRERVVKMERRLGEIVDVYFYDYGEYEIWGATAHIIRAFVNEFVQTARAG